MYIVKIDKEIFKTHEQRGGGRKNRRNHQPTGQKWGSKGGEKLQKKRASELG